MGQDRRAGAGRVYCHPACVKWRRSAKGRDGGVMSSDDQKVDIPQAARESLRGSGSRMQYRCSFCGKGQDEVKRLIAGPGGVYICDECVELCREIIIEDAGDAQTDAQQAPDATCHFCGKGNDEVAYIIYGAALPVREPDWRFMSGRHHPTRPQQTQQWTICSECIDACRSAITSEKVGDQGAALLGTLHLMQGSNLDSNVIGIAYLCSFCGNDQTETTTMFAKIGAGCICAECVTRCEETIAVYQRAAASQGPE